MAERELSGRGEQTRELILATAMAAFAESGYAAASLRDIAARCTLTHPALIYHFPTKAALLMAVLERRDDRDGVEVDFHRLRGERLLRHLVDTASINATRRGIVELYATLSAEATTPSHPAHDFFVRRYASLRATVERAYRDLALAGRLRDEIDPALAAQQLVALMDGLQVQWLLDPAVDMAAAIDAHVAAQLA
ncbi:TetR/AcrR family transcriptional regulator [Demequina sp.]|uniref:TetR/AcrR family transcriptional regulator n=1 Tax=Demequina sp. TaxID=2050685 RepID=UPI0025E1D7CD|nr:TetR/AcrR family transcriptional regulator [Demequina sp.]